MELFALLSWRWNWRLAHLQIELALNPADSQTIFSSNEFQGLIMDFCGGVRWLCGKYVGSCEFYAQVTQSEQEPCCLSSRLCSILLATCEAVGI